MTDILLVSGFLGAGKTTLVNRILSLYADRKAAVIVNEYGRVAVDDALITPGVDVEAIAGGSIFCSCRFDQFERALALVLGHRPGLLLIEASGLSDPTAVEQILERFQPDHQLRYLGAVCLVDALRVRKVLATAVVVPKQLAAARLLLINKIDLVAAETLPGLAAELSSYAPGAKIAAVSNAAVEAEDLDWMFASLPDRKAADVFTPHRQDLSLRKALIRLIPNVIDEAALRDFVAGFAPAAWRVKGFVTLVDGRRVLVDSIGDDVQVRLIEQTGTAADETAAGSALVVLSAKDRSAAARIREAAAAYAPYVEGVDYEL